MSACVEAYRTTEDSRWLNEARLAFEWFLGRNDVGLELYDASTGGCHDGLHEDRINENQGAESTLAFLLSLAELKLVESSLAAFRRAAQAAAWASLQEAKAALDAKRQELGELRARLADDAGRLVGVVSMREVLTDYLA